MGTTLEAKEHYLHYKLGQAYEKIRKYVEAESSYVQAVKLNRQNPFSYAALVNMKLNVMGEKADSSSIMKDVNTLLSQAESRGIKKAVLKLTGDMIP